MGLFVGEQKSSKLDCGGLHNSMDTPKTIELHTLNGWNYGR